MAFIITAEGALININGNSYPQGESATSLNTKLAANNQVIIYDESEETPKANAVFTDYTVDGVTGTTLGSAQAVSNAIGALIATANSSGIQVVQFANAVSGDEEPSIAANASSVELIAATARFEAFITNDGTGILFITEGATATVNSAIKLLQDDVYRVTSGLVVNGIWLNPDGFARINQTKT